MLRWMKSRLLGMRSFGDTKDRISLAQTVIPAASKIALSHVSAATELLSQHDTKSVRERRSNLITAAMTIRAALVAVETAIDHVGVLLDE